MEWKAFTNKVIFGDGDVYPINQNDELLAVALETYESAKTCKIKVVASGFWTVYQPELIVGDTIYWVTKIRTQFNLAPTRIYLLNENDEILAEFKVRKHNGEQGIIIRLEDEDVSSPSRTEFSRN